MNNDQRNPKENHNNGQLELNPNFSDRPQDNRKKKKTLITVGALTLAAFMVVGSFFAGNILHPDYAASSSAKSTASKEISEASSDDTGSKSAQNDNILRLNADTAPWFSVDGTGILRFNGTLFDGEVLEIPRVFEGVSVTTLSGFSFSQKNKTVTEVKIPEGVRTIETDAFKNFTALQKVSFPSSVVRIKGEAFHNTPWYKSLKDEFTVVGGGVLVKYSGTDERASVPGTVYYIDCAAFMGNETLKRISIPKNVVYIGEKAFMNTAATEVDIPVSVSFIENDAFENSAWLNDKTDDFLIVGDGCVLTYKAENGVIDPPENARMLSGLNFGKSGEGLTLKIGKNVLKIADLEKLGEVSAFEVDDKNPAFKAVDGVLCSYNGDVIYRYPIYREGDSYTVPKSVSEISNRSFMNAKIREIQMEGAVQKIGNHAFSGCTKLTSIPLMKSVATLGRNAFENCRSLESVTLPKSITTVPVAAFSGCKNLLSVTLSEKTRVISDEAFKNCPKLETLYLPDRVRFVSVTAFQKSNVQLELDPENPYVTLENNQVVAKKQ